MQTQRVWEADLTEPGKKLTLEELIALEAMHQCMLLKDMHEYLRDIGAVLHSLEARVDRVEQYLSRIDPRYPRTAAPDLTMPKSLGGPG